MGNHNSLEAELTTASMIMQQLFIDIAQCYPECNEVQQDLKKFRSRVQREGFSFLTKTLPSMGKAIDFALHTDSALSIKGFKTRGSAIPKFLGWLLDRVFLATGYVRIDADVTALKHVRQLVYFMYKLDVPYAPKTQKKVLDAFIQTEEDIKNIDVDSSDPVIRQARTLCSRLFAGFDAGTIIPRHGPGSVATGEKVNEKQNFSRIFSKLHSVYPFDEYFTMGLSHVSDDLDWIRSLEVHDTATAKVVLVPKDSRGPRLISAEPLELQWIQQGLQRAIYPLVERHWLTAGHVNFTDQSINQYLALAGSRTGRFVTLDMKDASDRVSLRLVEELFAGTSLLQALIACRSDMTRLPDGRVVSMAKFAPMGSAVCFPVEALCFWALAVSVLTLNGRYCTRGENLAYGLNHVWVYGDDIIMREEDYSLVLQYFPKVGLKFNESKCCTRGFFRESCGVDAFKGEDVTPIRLRTRWSSRNRLDASELCSYVALGNALYSHGYWSTASMIVELVEARYGPLPYYEHTHGGRPTNLSKDRLVAAIRTGAELPRPERDYSNITRTRDIGDPRPYMEVQSMLGWRSRHVNHTSLNKKRIKHRWNAALQRFEVRVWVVKPGRISTENDGWKEMLRVINTGSTGSKVGIYALPRRSCLKRGWSPICY